MNTLATYLILPGSFGHHLSLGAEPRSHQTTHYSERIVGAEPGKRMSNPHNEIRPALQPQPPDTNNITAYLLRNLSQGLVDALNTIPDRAADAFLQKHMAFHFCMYNSGGHESVLPHVQSRGQQIDNILALRKVHPEWKLAIYHLSAVVEKGAEEGVVLYTSRSQGGPEDEFNPHQEMVGRFSWRKRVDDGVWECYRHEGIRGGGDFYS